MNGSTGLEGRVEICYRRFWGTVCDSQWDAQDAAVICRQLGHSSTGMLKAATYNYCRIKTAFDSGIFHKLQVPQPWMVDALVKAVDKYG